MNLTLRQLRVFVHLSHSLSFRATAEQFGVTQPTMSKIVSEMEVELGVKLFERSTRRVRLSHEGEELLGVASQIIDDYDHGLDELAQVAHRQSLSLSIASLPALASYLLPEPINRLRLRYPEIKLQVRDVYAEMAIELLRTRIVDVAFSCVDDIQDDLHYSCVIKEHFVLLISRTHARRLDRDKWSSSTIDGVPLIGMNRGTSTRNAVDAAFLRMGMRFRPALELLHIRTIASFVNAGFGAAILPMSGVDGLMDERNTILPLPDFPPRSVAIITRRGSRLSQPARYFIDDVKGILAQIPQHWWARNRPAPD